MKKTGCRKSRDTLPLSVKKWKPAKTYSCIFFVIFVHSNKAQRAKTEVDWDLQPHITKIPSQGFDRLELDRCTDSFYQAVFKCRLFSGKDRGRPSSRPAATPVWATTAAPSPTWSHSYSTRKTVHSSSRTGSMPAKMKKKERKKKIFLFREDGAPMQPVHRTQSLLVGGVKAARPQVAKFTVVTWCTTF